ncbi:TPA: glycoside hydrolase family 104 protein [Citrobacter freundii]|uniref:glycoside hydrolase family 24 protein n=1 Tax=Citrobacter freundii complex TaxID=1344959 RepID=UPI001901C797|nr:glycoside hydrolase family 104 protein [Citrobacter freundii]ELT3493877.1 glycoside hydrolase family 104 protein [Citrobacter freundii]MBJ8882482.1 glycoside hydrolase family 104 protein [Citrobacter freundii]MDT7355357.1 glycoside hydrolase family 104 protein [Citrobacter freundii]HAT2419563.1 glycoside hydrolase family 104 protein [Citrobacter freundii]HAT3774788.1 glycoside hydrolase family 104 protein [Citrobacter freundii]
MQTINPQRKAFLDMLAWSEGTDKPGQPTKNHGYDVIVGGSLFTDYSEHPRKLITLNPKLKSTAAGRYQLLARYWDAYRKQLGLKDFSPASQDAVALQQIKERGALPMIDRGDIRQAIDRCSNIWASLPGAGYGQLEHKADTLIAKFKEAGGKVNESAS